MTSPLTYLEFLSIFLVVPVALLTVVVSRSKSLRRVVTGVGVLVCIATLYTAPWDSYLIARGVWWYGEGVVAARLWRVPLGEWLFFVFQTTMTGLWFYAITPRVEPALPRHVSARWVGAGVWGLLSVVGGLLALSSAKTYYLGMILVWAGPVLAFLWSVGGPVIWRYRRVVAIGVGVPSLYLWVIDRIAIGMGLWTISPEFSSGFSLFGLPVEEAVFFLLTNALVVQGLLLFEWVVVRADERGLGYAVEGLIPRLKEVNWAWS